MSLKELTDTINRVTMSNLFSCFQQNFPSNRQSPFLFDETNKQQERAVFSYADVEQLSARLANYFCDIGLQKGDRIAVQVEKSPMALMVYLASLRVGLIYLPLNTAYTDSELAYFIEDAEPRFMLCDPAKQVSIETLIEAANTSARVETLDNQAGGSLVDAIQSYSTEFETRECDDDDTAAILYTSGTTGRPKGAMLSHHNLQSNAYALKVLWGWSESDVLLHALPIFHVHGLFVACHCVLAAGASMIFQNGFNATDITVALPKSTVMMGVPTFYTRLLAREGFDAAACSTIRLFISGSAPLLESTHQGFESRTGHKILERYGMTETGMLVSNPLQGERRAGTVGFPLPELIMRIAGADNEPLAVGEIGSIQVKGPNVFKAYWRKPDKTAQEFTADGYFITGDQGRLSEDGYISIVGRAKDMVITGGFNVYPKEVELVLDAIEGVKEAAVIGLPHVDFGEAVTAVVVAEEGCTPNDIDIIAQAKDKLGGFKVPKRIYVVDALPRNAMGKVQKNVLREQFSNS